MALQPFKRNVQAKYSLLSLSYLTTVCFISVDARPVATRSQRLTYPVGSSVTNGSGLVNHATHIGINLRSAGIMKHPPPSARSLSRSAAVSARVRNPKLDILPLSAWDRPHEQYATPEYVQNVVVAVSISFVLLYPSVYLIKKGSRTYTTRLSCLT